ncbi:hypothetical protein JCM8208_007678 [Rhodotorula glutinis]
MLLPVATDFPGQVELATTVLAEVNAIIAARSPTLPPLSSMDELALLRTVSEEHRVFLPFKWLSILTLHEDIEHLFDAYDEMNRLERDRKMVLLSARDLVRSERFQYATAKDKAAVGHIWGLIEAKNGEGEKAKAAWEWLRQLGGKVEGKGSAELGLREALETCLWRINMHLEATRAPTAAATAPNDEAVIEYESEAATHEEDSASQTVKADKDIETRTAPGKTVGHLRKASEGSQTASPMEEVVEGELSPGER